MSSCLASVDTESTSFGLFGLTFLQQYAEASFDPRLNSEYHEALSAIAVALFA